MRQYLDFMKDVLENGETKSDRTGTGTISRFGAQVRYDLRKGFPLMTTKQMAKKAMIVELIWFLAGDTNIQYLVKNNCKIWNEWPYEAFKKSDEYKGETMEQFIEMVKNDDAFAKVYGDLGPVYGRQWRNFFGVDQITNLINDIKTNPNSRRLIVSAWNPAQINEMALPPCHAFFQFYVSKNGELSCQLYQRSADIFLGVPFNVASYSLLIHMIAHVTGLKVGEFVHTIGDAHIYSNHIDQVNEQLSREPLPLCNLVIKRKVDSIFDFKIDDFEFEGYESHPALKAPVAV